MAKKFHLQDNIGRAKYTVSFHDGVKTHPDGSPFYDIRTFTSKKKKTQFVETLKSQGYTEFIKLSTYSYNRSKTLNKFDVFDQ
jgi:hypothetical protein